MARRAANTGRPSTFFCPRCQRCGQPLLWYVPSDFTGGWDRPGHPLMGWCVAKWRTLKRRPQLEFNPRLSASFDPTSPNPRTCLSSRSKPCSSRDLRDHLRRGHGLRRSRAGLTVSASIPHFRPEHQPPARIRQATILENNIVQTAGSAGNPWPPAHLHAAGVDLYGFPSNTRAHFLLALIAVDRRAVHDPAAPQLIVQEHGNLRYRGDGLRRRAGRGVKGGLVASRVSGAWGSAARHLPDGHRAGVEAAPALRADVAARASFRADITSEYLASATSSARRAPERSSPAACSPGWC